MFQVGGGFRGFSEGRISVRGDGPGCPSASARSRAPHCQGAEGRRVPAPSSRAGFALLPVAAVRTQKLAVPGFGLLSPVGALASLKWNRLFPFLTWHSPSRVLLTSLGCRGGEVLFQVPLERTQGPWPCCACSGTSACRSWVSFLLCLEGPVAARVGW